MRRLPGASFALGWQPSVRWSSFPNDIFFLHSGRVVSFSVMMPRFPDKGNAHRRRKMLPAVEWSLAQICMPSNARAT